MLTSYTKYVLIVVTVTAMSSHILSSRAPENEEHHGERQLIRKSRSPNPRAFLEPIFRVKRIHNEQKNDTEQTLRTVYNIIADTFSDTYTTTPKPLIMDNDIADGVNITTTTEKYRISRAEVGKILRRNVLGLQRLFQIELNDALNQSTYSIAEHKGSKVTKFG